MNFKKKIIKGNDGLEDMLADDDMEGQIYKCDHCEFITHLGIILLIQKVTNYNFWSQA